LSSSINYAFCLCNIEWYAGMYFSQGIKSKYPVIVILLLQALLASQYRLFEALNLNFRQNR